jgi:mRNA deadenylase 3'-5' endonuclease subunit Ccr4
MADIICLQEIDTDKALSFWKQQLDKLGYEIKFLTRKTNGLIIGFLRNK